MCLVIIWFLYLVREILFPFVSSLILAYLLNPLVNYFEVKGIKRSSIVVIFYLFFVGILIIGAFILLPKMLEELLSLKNNLPVYISQIKNSLLTLSGKVEKYYPSLGDKQLSEVIVQKIQVILQSAIANMPRYLMNFFSLFSLFILIPFITFFLLLEWKKWSYNLFNFLPSKYVETVLSIMCEINEVLGNFIRGQIIGFIWVTFLTICGLIYLQVDYAILFGFFIGITNFIPYIGPILGAIPLVLVVLFKYGIIMPLKVIVLVAIVQFLDCFVISPYAISKSVKLHFILVIFALLAGAKIFGFFGIILGVPIVCVIKVILQILYNRLKGIDIRKIKQLDSQKILLEQFKA